MGVGLALFGTILAVLITIKMKCRPTPRSQDDSEYSNNDRGTPDLLGERYHQTPPHKTCQVCNETLTFMNL